MKKLFGMALLALPFLVGSAHANGWPFNVQAGGSLYIKAGPGIGYPQAGPWYLYWPLEAHFVAPAPTGYPYWPGPMGLPPTTFGGPACLPPQAVAPPPVAVAPPPVVTTPSPTLPAPVPNTPAPRTTPQSGSPLQLPPYLQPTSYTIPAPSYWYDR
jgi:hypothetical protein